MDWALLASNFWKLSLGIFFIGLIVVTGYLCAALHSLRKSLKSGQDTLDSIENIVSQEVRELIMDMDETLKEVNITLPALLQNLSALALSWQNISESEIRPTLHNVQETSAALNRSTQELGELVRKVNNFSRETLEQVAFFRNQLAGFLANVVSWASGVKAGWRSFVSRKSN